MDDKKGQDIVALDVSKLTSVTDIVVICTGWSGPHLKALANEVIKQTKEAGHPVYRKSGATDCGWIVLDYIDVVIHIFESEKRGYYALETLWEDAPRLT